MNRREPGRVSIIAVVREAIAAARSQPVASAVTMLMVAGMVISVMLTTGRTVGAEQAVLGSIDDAGTRMIEVRAESGAGLTSSVLGRIADIEGIEWAGAFSSATDATNALVPDGTRVPVRHAYGAGFDQLGIRDLPGPNLSGIAGYASAEALVLLGLTDSSGALTTVDTGAEYSVVGRIRTPDFLREFEPLVLVPREDLTGMETVSVLVIIAERPDLVAPLTSAVTSVLAVDDPSEVTVHTSEALARLRSLVQAQLSTFSRGLVLVMLLVTGLLVAVILYGLVMMRRKDFGRRRALGATRALIVSLLLTQTAVLALFGVTVGLGASLLCVLIMGDPLPGTTFTVALAVLAIATSLFAALVPALVASKREPIRELRVP
ncbi:ABC transporter permease [Microbacterium sp. NPDC057407]|uniref:ABC transporter permease n=1 Tax=Microbacterium sp. NPDC057407 TaxID=3346120 RepID=UPI00366B8986